jgi:hypothetical protein
MYSLCYKFENNDSTLSMENNVSLILVLLSLFIMISGLFGVKVYLF